MEDMEHVCGCGANGAPRIVQGNDFTLRVRVLRSVLRDGIAQREDIGLEGCTGVSASLVSRTGKRIPLTASVNDGRLLVDVDETVPVGAYGLEVKGRDANGSDWRSMRRPGEFLRVVGTDGEATGLPDGGVYDVSADVAYSSVSAGLAGRLNDAAKEASEAAREAREAAAGALSRLSHTSMEMGKAEGSRKANEEERKANEEQRKADEAARQEAEKKREEAEAAREAAAARSTVEVRRGPSGRLYSGTTYAEASRMLEDGKRVDYTFPDGTMLEYPDTFHGAHLSGDQDYIVSAETYMEPHSSKPQISFLIHHEDDSFNVINSPYFGEDGISGHGLSDNSVTADKIADQAVTKEKLSQDLRQEIFGANAPLTVTLTGYREETGDTGKKASFTASVAAEGVAAAILGGTNVLYLVEYAQNGGFAAMRDAGLSSVAATPSGCAVKDGGGSSVRVSVLGMGFTHSGTEAVCDMRALSILE